jgi:hypothetical protein
VAETFVEDDVCFDPSFAELGGELCASTMAFQGDQSCIRLLPLMLPGEE